MGWHHPIMRTVTKTLVLLLFFFLSLLVAQEEPAARVKLLTIGNSFADDATAYLPALAKEGDLLLFRANIGGCTLERHVRHLTAFEANPDDPQGRPYRGVFVLSNGGVKPPAAAADETVETEVAEVVAEPPENLSLREALEAEKWDYVTIQQLSNLSFRYETFEPYAGTLIGYVRKYAPTAEILIHQTWAYREDCPLYQNGFNQEKMFAGLVAAYGKLAEKYQLRVVPVGTAMQKARKLPRWTFKFPDPSFNYKQPLPETLPDQKGSLNVGWTVRKVTKTVNSPGVAVIGAAEGGTAVVEAPEQVETWVASLDFKHCNAEGKYLGAAVFHEFLLGDAARNAFVPPDIQPEDAEVLRKVADEVVAAERATGGSVGESDLR